MTNRLINALINNTDFRDGLFSRLGATEVSIVIHLYNIPMTDKERERYLNPLRDVELIAGLVALLIEMGRKPTLIGLDTFNLIDRIRDPIQFWKKERSKKELTLWLAIEEPARADMDAERKIYDMTIDAFSHLNSYMTRDSIMIVTTTEGYPLRLVLKVSMAIQAITKLDGSLHDWALKTVDPDEPIFRHKLKEVVEWDAFSYVNRDTVETGVIDLVTGEYITSTAQMVDVRQQQNNPVIHMAKKPVVVFMAVENSLEHFWATFM